MQKLKPKFYFLKFNELKFVKQILKPKFYEVKFKNILKNVIFMMMF
jgi:hypothetical protein